MGEELKRGGAKEGGRGRLEDEGVIWSRGRVAEEGPGEVGGKE